MQSHKCYLYSDTKTMTIDVVIVGIHPFYSELSFLKKRPRKGLREEEMDQCPDYFLGM